MKNYRMHLLICNGSTCSDYGKEDISTYFKEQIAEYNLTEEIQIIKTGCFGLCGKGPIVNVMPDNIYYGNVKPTDIKEIIEYHIINGNPVNHLLLSPNDTNSEKNSKRKQIRIALRNCGIINPEDITEYIANEGYQALYKVLFEMTPDQAIQEVIDSGLRGRGGGGFPTGLKWQIASKNNSDQKYVVCNADEGDPGAFMDRSILEGDPHSVIEAMVICGKCINANKGLVYIRAEYPLAVERLLKAIQQAREYGFLGKNILNSGFDFDIELRYGAGAFVCGEETALIHSMEGLRGEPSVKPPFPAEAGYKNKPTNVNNVETLACIPVIFNKGKNWFNKIGTEKSKGTKVFALAGKINNVGLIEVPMGTTLREVIYQIGGGIKNGKKFKAVQTGGPSGGCLTEKHLDTPIDYDNLIQAGSMMGSGGMIVMDEDDCMVSIARFYLDFTCEESCGKCAPCRIGNKRLLEILDKIIEGKGTMEDLDNLINLSNVIKDTSLCGLGQSSPNPVLSTITNFWDEYVEHVTEHKCRAGVCKSLIHYI
ncbi:MAG TPA: NADH-ubiquinone oxidoreductase-F iron-sulfur binding region domain-containing protein, partial [Bacteroidales bacterium]|nr:NADH-ubiquinone oxidoreductase-F iron-sulfur binding region domain-containing protein [Bacteroidales bacterium]